PSSTLFPYTTLFRSVVWYPAFHVPPVPSVANPVAYAGATDELQPTDDSGMRTLHSSPGRAVAVFAPRTSSDGGVRTGLTRARGRGGERPRRRSPPAPRPEPRGRRASRTRRAAG